MKNRHKSSIAVYILYHRYKIAQLESDIEFHREQLEKLEKEQKRLGK